MGSILLGWGRSLRRRWLLLQRVGDGFPTSSLGNPKDKGTQAGQSRVTKSGTKLRSDRACLPYIAGVLVKFHAFFQQTCIEHVSWPTDQHHDITCEPVIHVEFQAQTQTMGSESAVSGLAEGM